jgi:serine/threonine protein kinase
MEDQLKFELNAWDKITSTCKNLIIELLKKSALQRISLDEALQHSWFNSVRGKFSSDSLGY